MKKFLHVKASTFNDIQCLLIDSRRLIVDNRTTMTEQRTTNSNDLTAPTPCTLYPHSLLHRIKVISMERYRKLSGFLKEKYGEKVHRIPIFGGFSCPNRDGTKSKGGCIFCDPMGSGFATFYRLPIREQVLKYKEKLERRGIKKFKPKAQFAGRKLHLEKEEVDKIKQLWTIRSTGDFVHARKRGNYLPPQWPSPSDCELFVNYFDLINLSQRILIRYFDYIKNRYTVLINPSKSSYLDDENLTFVVASNILYTSWDNGHFEIKINEKNKRKLSWFIKKEVAKVLKVSISRIKILEHRRNKIVLKVF